MADEIRATPQSPIAGAIARKLRSLQELAARYEVDKRIPLFGGTSVDELLSLPGAASLAEDISYDGLRRLIRGGNAATGGIGTYRLDPRVADLADVAGAAGSLAGLGAKAAKPVGKLAAEGIARSVERGSPLTALAQPMHVVKPKGGNWLAGSVENVVRPLKRHQNPQEALNFAREQLAGPLPGDTYNALMARMPDWEREVSINNWIDQKLAKYIRNEMATPEDPLRALVLERGVSHVPLETLAEGAGFIPSEVALARKRAGFPEVGVVEEGSGVLYGDLSDLQRAASGWETLADAAINAHPILSPEAAQTAAELLGMPPGKTPPLGSSAYSVASVNPPDLGFGHLVDELRNATRAGTDLPPELRLRPDQLSKVSMPQAVELVDRINKWRAAQKAEADLARSTNAATVEYKAYPTVPGTEAPNERGLRWVELKAGDLPEGWREEGGRVLDPEGGFKQALSGGDPRYTALADALKYEGEVMGHCVGGYCPDVLAGRSRIFSLRDKKGEPHVTIEVKPGRRPSQSEAGLQAREEGLRGQAFAERVFDLMEGKDVPDEITQIKGKANRAPKEDYLPFVQDFVKSQQWGRVGDVQNAGLIPIDPTSDLAARIKAAGKEPPKFVTQQELTDLLQKNADLEKGYAAGGAVVAGPRSYDPQAVERLAAQLIEDTYA